jgi:hypothetical protein
MVVFPRGSTRDLPVSLLSLPILADWNGHRNGPHSAVDNSREVSALHALVARKGMPQRTLKSSLRAPSCSPTNLTRSSRGASEWKSDDLTLSRQPIVFRLSPNEADCSPERPRLAFHRARPKRSFPDRRLLRLSVLSHSTLASDIRTPEAGKS